MPNINSKPPLEIRDQIAQTLNIPVEEAQVIVDKAQAGSEFTDENSAKIWLEQRFLPNVVYIDETGYAKMCIDALKILRSTAATDYGSSRQRDLGQLWGDMTRGYLAEYAFVLFLQKHWGIETQLGHDAGTVAEFLPSDLQLIKKPSDSTLRIPHINVGIKGTKWNGIWFDIPGAQFSHSDIHVLIKVGTSRDHLFAYFKHLSVFKDKILKRGVELGAINQSEADFLYDSLPLFQPIPAYVAGFVVTDQERTDLPYSGKKGRIHFKVKSWNGAIKSGDLQRIKEQEGLTKNGKVKFEGIGDFSHENGYLFNVGNLLWTKEDWEQHVIKNL